MSSTNRRSFLGRSAALAVVPTVAALAGGTLTGQASAATLADSAPVPPSALPLTNRHLTEREKANLAVVLQAYHDGEGDSLDPQGFMDLFAADGAIQEIRSGQELRRPSKWTLPSARQPRRSAHVRPCAGGRSCGAPVA
jgi:hypothetical protein